MKMLAIAVFILVIINLINTIKVMEVENRLAELEKKEKLEPLVINGEVRGYYIKKGAK